VNQVTALAVHGETLFVGFGDGRRGAVARCVASGHFQDVEGAPEASVTCLVVQDDFLWVAGAGYPLRQVAMIDRKTGERKLFGGFGYVYAAPGGVFVTGGPYMIRMALIEKGGAAVRDLPRRLPPRFAAAKHVPLFIQVVADGGDRIWFGGSVADILEGSALYSMDPASGEVTLYGKAQGVTCTEVSDILRHGGAVWVASNQGLIRVRSL